MCDRSWGSWIVLRWTGGMPLSGATVMPETVMRVKYTPQMTHAQMARNCTAVSALHAAARGHPRQVKGGFSGTGSPSVCRSARGTVTETPA